MQYGYVYKGDSTTIIDIAKMPAPAGMAAAVPGLVWEDKAVKGVRYEIIEAETKPF